MATIEELRTEYARCKEVENEAYLDWTLAKTAYEKAALELAKATAIVKEGDLVEHRKEKYRISRIGQWNGKPEYYGRKVLKDGVSLHTAETLFYGVFKKLEEPHAPDHP